MALPSLRSVCVVCSEKSNYIRRLESLSEQQLFTLKSLVFTEFPSDAEKLLSASDHVCRPCFRALGTVVRLKKELLTKEQALIEKIRQSGLAWGLGLQVATCSTCKLCYTTRYV